MDNIVKFPNSRHRREIEILLTDEELAEFTDFAASIGLTLDEFVTNAFEGIANRYSKMSPDEQKRFFEQLDHLDKFGTTRPILKIVH